MSLDEALRRARTWSAFLDYRQHLCTSADLQEVVAAAHEVLRTDPAATVAIFDDATGARTDASGPVEAVRRRLQPPAVERRPGPGRPKLGVVSREVSLLPRHWEWLGSQRGGASAALRRLVDEARKRTPARDAARLARDSAYQALVNLGGDRPNFEEAARALYQDDFARAAELVGGWPEDLRAHMARLLENARELEALARVEEAGGGA